ncbi:frizzled-4-like [Panonychus citri]|uniref:frizzled-4-like n=1 Tax=Panonychus citri TaxID=50023 RepID=UPI002307110A|nr:frizzled-4-like [Panonychus citri]
MVNPLLVVILFCSYLQNVVQSSAPPSVRTCEPIRLEMCKKIGYNATGLPNLAGHETQDEAEQSLKTFNPLISIGCSSQLQFFLCSVHVPMCDEKIVSTLGPCRRLCETVRDRCLFILNEFGYPWPAHLNCSLFPLVNDHQNMCMEGPGEDTNKQRSSTSKITILNYKTSINPDKNREVTHQPVITEIVTPSITNPQNNHSKLYGPIVEDCLDLKFHQQYFKVRRSDNGSQCSHGCIADILYPSTTKQFTEFWIAFWSTFCFVSSIFTILMFSRSNVRIDYPERAIVFMACNYFVFSSIHLVAIFIGRAKISCYEDDQYHVSLLIKNSYQNPYCVTVFTLLYYSQMSSLIWWLVLSFTLYFTVAKQWSSSKLSDHSNYYHSLAWGIPTLSTILIFMIGDIGADELTGNCNVGSNNPQSLLYFIIIPMATILLIGSVIFILTIRGYFKGRTMNQVHTSQAHHHRSYQSSSEKISYNNLSSQNSHPPLIQSQIVWTSQPRLTEELGIALIRLFLFQIIYFAISSYLLFVSFYEYLNKNDWYSVSTNDLPNVEIMSLKIFMSFLAGIMTGIWIWMSEPNFPCVIRADWQKSSQPSIQIIPQHNNIHILPVTSSSLVTIDGRRRCYHPGSETTV